MRERGESEVEYSMVGWGSGQTFREIGRGIDGLRLGE